MNTIRSVVGVLGVAAGLLAGCAAPALPQGQLMVGCSSCRVPVMVSNVESRDKTRFITLTSAIQVDEISNSFHSVPDSLADEVLPRDEWLQFGSATFTAQDETRSNFILDPPQGHSDGFRRLVVDLGAHR